MLNWYYIKNKLEKYDLYQALGSHHYNFLSNFFLNAGGMMLVLLCKILQLLFF